MKKLIFPILIIIAFILAAPASSLARKGRGYYNHQNYHGQRYKNRSYFTGNFHYGAPYGYYPRPYGYYAPLPPPPVVYYGPPAYYVPYAPYPPVSGQLFFGITID